MSVIKKLNDSIRIKILSAMTKKGCVSPNIRQIKKVTGLHRATIKSSIDFLESEKFITGYRPLLDPKVIGYDLNAFSYMQADIMNKENYKKFIEIVQKDKNVYHCSEVISDNNTNLAVGFLSKNIEDYYNNVRNKYNAGMFNYYDFIKKNSVFYLSNPYHKHKNEIDVIIDLLIEEQGIEQK